MFVNVAESHRDTIIHVNSQSTLRSSGLSIVIGTCDTMTQYYTSTPRENHIAIDSRTRYLDAIRNGKELPILKNRHAPPWNGAPTSPVLDVKVVNNTADVLFFHNAKFTIASSRLDPRPLPFLIDDHHLNPPCVFYLRNFGWGDMSQCELRFRLFREEMPITDSLVWEFKEPKDTYKDKVFLQFLQDKGVYDSVITAATGEDYG